MWITCLTTSEGNFEQMVKAVSTGFLHCSYYFSFVISDEETVEAI